jgi:hypothetical protein
MTIMLLLQYEADTFTLQFMLSAAFLLFLITMYLFAASILIRNAKLREEHHSKECKDRFYPYILTHMVGDEIDMNELNSDLRNSDDFKPLVSIIYEMIESVQGDERTRLRELLHLPKLQTYYFKLLQSSRKNDITEACLYYSHVSDFTEKEYQLLSKLLDDENLLYVHIAATAIIRSPLAEQRYEALRAMCSRERVSKLAIIDQLYMFRNLVDDQMDREVSLLNQLVRDTSLNDRNLGMVIKGICDIGYVSMALDLYELLEEQLWAHSEYVTEALIYSMGRFEFSMAADFIVDNFAKDSRPRVRRACASALELFADDAYNEVLFDLAQDEEFSVRLKAIYALAGIGDTGKKYLLELSAKTLELRNLIRGVLAEVEGQVA